MIQNLHVGDVFFDVGANIGYYSVIASSQVGASGRVFAFEPEPLNYELLNRNIRLNALNNVQTIPKAVTHFSGSSYLYLCEDNKGDHRLFDSGDKRARVAVECVDLDSFVESMGTRVDFVKLDTQGSEASILKGMQRTLQREAGRIKLVLEFWPHGLVKNGSSAAGLLELIPAEKFDFYWVDEQASTLRPTVPQQVLRRSEHSQWLTKEQGYLNLFLKPKSGPEVLQANSQPSGNASVSGAVAPPSWRLAGWNPALR